MRADSLWLWVVRCCGYDTAEMKRSPAKRAHVDQLAAEFDALIAAARAESRREAFDTARRACLAVFAGPAESQDGSKPDSAGHGFAMAAIECELRIGALSAKEPT